MSSASELWWVFVAATVVALILTGAFVASVVIQQRRFLSTTRQFGGRLLAAQEEERAWIARELHDDIIQRVAVLGREIDQLGNGGAAAERVRLAGLREELHDLAGEIRRLAHRMHPAALDHLGLSAALVQLAAEFGEQGLQVRLDSTLPADTLPPRVATCLYRVAQEALRNIARHAGAEEAVLTLRQEGDGVLLEVQDSGIGFDTSSPAARAGLGLTSLGERMRLVHGRFSVRSLPGQGTRIAAWVPLERRVRGRAA